MPEALAGERASQITCLLSEKFTSPNSVLGFEGELGGAGECGVMWRGG